MDEIRDLQRQLAEDQVRMFEDNVRLIQEHIDWLEATPEYQEQEARRRASAELRSLGEHEAASLVSGL